MCAVSWLHDTGRPMNSNIFRYRSFTDDQCTNTIGAPMNKIDKVRAEAPNRQLSWLACRQKWQRKGSTQALCLLNVKSEIHTTVQTLLFTGQDMYLAENKLESIASPSAFHPTCTMIPCSV